MKEFYNSLNKLISNNSRTYRKMKNKTSKFPGYPHYPANEDIYKKGIKETDINPENTTKKKAPGEKKPINKKVLFNEKIGYDLDVPGSELDDQQESIGSEDEENNYYSLGGDNHKDLEEDNN